MALRELINLIGFELDEGKLRAVENRIQGAFAQLTNRGTALGNILQSIAIPALGVSAVSAFEEWNVAMAEVRQRIISTGSAAGKTAEELHNISENLAEGTNFTHDAILSAEGALLKFRGVAGDIFDRTTKAAIDFAAANKMDVVGSIELLGRVLQGSGERMMALERAGIHFTKQEKEMMKNLVASGRQQEYQRFILGRLEQSYKGAASAIAKAGSGVIGFKKSVEDMLEEFGKVLFPYFQKFYSFLSSVMNRLRDMSPTTKNFIITLSGVASAILGIVALLPALKGIIALFNPWVLAIVAVGIALALLLDDMRAWASGNDSFLGSVLGSWKDFIFKLQIFFAPLVDILMSTWESIKGIFVSAIDLIKALFSGNSEGAKKALMDLFGYITGLLNNLLDLAIMSIVQFGPVVLKAAYTLIYTIADVLRTLLTSVLSSVWEMVLGFFKSIGEKLSDFFSNPLFKGIAKFMGTAGRGLTTLVTGAGDEGVSTSSLAPSPASINNMVNGGKKEVNVVVNQTVPPGTKGEHADFIKKTTKETFEVHMNRMLRGVLANQPEVP
jgi:hypothetical protein